MELDDLKSSFRNAGKGQLSRSSLEKMMLGHHHPVLKGIRRQLIIESVLWTLFLAVYYDFFDGHLKSPAWNMLLVLSVAGMLVHNVLGYRVSRNPIKADNILRSLEKYLNQIRKYSKVSIASRVLAIAMLFGYFISTIELTEEKYWSLGLLGLIFPVQAYLLNIVWSKRINTVNEVYQKLKS